MNLTSAQRQTLSWIGIALAAAALLWLLSPVLMPFIAAAVAAYVLHPAVEALASRRVPRALAVILVVAMAIVLLLAVMLLIVPVLVHEVPLLRQQIPLLAERLNQTVSPWLASHGIQVALDVDSLKAFVVKYLDANLEDWLAALLSSARIGGSFLLAIVGNALLIPVVLFYLLADWAALVRRVFGMVPPRLKEPVTLFLDECDLVLGQYLRGQVLVMLSLAAYYSVALALVGLDLALPVGVFTGLAIFIPYLGFGLGLALALLAAALQFGTLGGVLAVVAVYGVGQVVESFFLTPRLVGERIGLSPLAVIFALLAFGHLLGFVGVLVALPLSAVGLVALRRLRRAYLDSRLYQG